MSGSNGESSTSAARRLPREDAAPWPSGDPSQSEEKSRRPSGGSEEDIGLLEADLHGRLSEWGPLLIAGQRLLVWERPLPSLLTAAAVHGIFWIFSYLSPRPLFLVGFFLLCLLGVQHWKSWLLRHCNVQTRTESSGDSETLAAAGSHHRLLSVRELCHYLAETWLTCRQYVQELLLYKKQNPGKFCAMVCACCAVLAVVGHYVPGIMISYIILLSVLLWPLVVYRELIQKMYTTLEPVLMKIDYTMKGEDRPRSHKKRQGKKEPEGGEEPTAETDSDSETELSAFSPEMDVRITALALSITDSELSDEEASILESGGFSVSRATTPQLTDVSEDLDQSSAGCEDAVPGTDPAESLGHYEGEGKPIAAAEFPTDPLTPEELLPTLAAAGSPPTDPLKPEELLPTLGAAGSPPTDPLNPEEMLPTLAGAGSPLFPTDPLNPEELLPTLTSPLHFVNTHFNGKGQAGVEIRSQEAMLQSPATPHGRPGLSRLESQESGGDLEDFELVEQGELDLLRDEVEETGKHLAATSSSHVQPD